MCETTFTGGAVAPACRDAALDAAKLLESMGHTLIPLLPKADHDGMMRAWPKIVVCGTGFGIRSKLANVGRDLAPDDVENISRSTITYAATVSGADYLQAVGKIHTYGREMAAVFDHIDVLLLPVMAEPPAVIGRFAHTATDFVDYRMGKVRVFDYSPFCVTFNASGQPAASVPTWWADGLPIGVHLAAAYGADALLISLCREIELARPRFQHRPVLSLPAPAKAAPAGAA